jgi:thioredoxin-related protein
MKKIFLIFGLLYISIYTFSQTKETLYRPEANATIELNNAIDKAKSQNKNVLVQIGGNWCKWCLRFNKFCNETTSIDSSLKADYIVLHINYSKENENFSLLQKYDNPQRFGFPVFLIIDANGKRLHTQDSGLLESGDGYDVEKVLIFLKQWTTTAVNPQNYTPKYKK